MILFHCKHLICFVLVSHCNYADILLSSPTWDICLLISQCTCCFQSIVHFCITYCWHRFFYLQVALLSVLSLSLSFILSENSWESLGIFLRWLFMKSSDKISIRHSVSSSPHVPSRLILFWCLVFPPFSGWRFDVSLSWLIGPKVWTFQKNGFTLATNWTMVQFDSGRDNLFRFDWGLAIWSGLWSRGGFIAGFLVPIKVKSLTVWTERGRCESSLSPSSLFQKLIYM